ncbi:MAG: hypothetical protein Q8M92_08595 [Candidatus Subteraquimicrobiales bacterium]|nr:hypothetical protein [Candidatus Subteraquimicrobiales bacterium]
MTAQFEKVQDFRSYLKGLVTDIRKAAADKDQARKGFISRKYRHYHLAYCMLRGTAYERIEAKVRDGNEPDFSLIEDIMLVNEGLKHVPRFIEQPTPDIAEG